MITTALFQIDLVDNVLIIAPHGSLGSLVGERIEGELNDILCQLGRDRLDRVVVDFQHVSYFGSTMMSAVQRIRHLVQADQGKLALCNVSPVGMEVLCVSGTRDLWPVCDTLEQAIESVR